MRSASRRWISAAKRSAVNSLARLRWFAPVGRAVAEHLGRKSLAQVTCCFSDERIRRAVQRSVLDLIGPETKIVSGHRWCRDRRDLGKHLLGDRWDRVEAESKMAISGKGPWKLGVETGVPLPPKTLTRMERDGSGWKWWPSEVAVWLSVAFPVDFNKQFWGDFPTLGLNKDAVYISETK